MSKLEQYAALKSMLHAMEKDLAGIGHITAQRFIISRESHFIGRPIGPTDLQEALNEGEFVLFAINSRSIKGHPLCVDLP